MTLARDGEAIAAARRRVSCLVLVTDRAAEEGSVERAEACRNQSMVEGKPGFRWLEGPAAVAPVMRETRTGIRALGFVFRIAPMPTAAPPVRAAPLARREILSRGRGATPSPRTARRVS